MLEIENRKWQGFDSMDQIGGRYFEGAFLEVYRNADGRVLVVGKGKSDDLGVTEHALGDMLSSMKECVAVHRLPVVWIDQIIKNNI